MLLYIDKILDIFFYIQLASRTKQVFASAKNQFNKPIKVKSGGSDSNKAKEERERHVSGSRSDEETPFPPVTDSTPSPVGTQEMVRNPKVLNVSVDIVGKVYLVTDPNEYVTGSSKNRTLYPICQNKFCWKFVNVQICTVIFKNQEKQNKHKR